MESEGCLKRTVLTGVLAAILLIISPVSFAHAGSSADLTAKVPFAFSDRRGCGCTTPVLF